MTSDDLQSLTDQIELGNFMPDYLFRFERPRQIYKKYFAPTFFDITGTGYAKRMDLQFLLLAFLLTLLNEGELK